MTSGGSAAAGWYEDPRDPSLWRYFDGAAWTSDTAPRLAAAAPTPERADEPAAASREYTQPAAAFASPGAQPGTVGAGAKGVPALAVTGSLALVAAGLALLTVWLLPLYAISGDLWPSGATAGDWLADVAGLSPDVWILIGAGCAAAAGAVFLAQARRAAGSSAATALGVVLICAAVVTMVVPVAIIDEIIEVNGYYSDETFLPGAAILVLTAAAGLMVWAGIRGIVVVRRAARGAHAPAHAAAAWEAPGSQGAPVAHGAARHHGSAVGAAPMTVGRLLFSAEGRIGRGWYWAGVGILFALSIPAFVLWAAGFGMMANDLETVAYGGTASGDSGGAVAMILLSALIQLALIVPGILVQIKRWHDRDKSGWFVLVGLIPIVGTIWVLVECGCLRGTIGPNRYGPDPLPAPHP